MLLSIIDTIWWLPAILVLTVVIYFLFRRNGAAEVIPADEPASTPQDDTVTAILDTVIVPPVPRLPIDVVVDDPPARPQFAIAHEPVAAIEGRYQDHPADRGNYNRRGELVGTNWGIAAPVAEEYFLRTVTKDDMKLLSESVAHDIFKINFWDRIRAADYPTQALADIVYDGAVNHGVRWGIKLLQRCLNLKEDGIIGPVTMAAVHAADPEQLLDAYFEARKRFYKAIVANRPSQAVFLRGWMRRLNHYA